MPVKPTVNEEEYFAKQEAERRRAVAQARQAQLESKERERARALHFMKCPKCGMQLQEMAYGEVRIDECFGCEGIWFDKGELEMLQSKAPSFITRLLAVFR